MYEITKDLTNTEQYRRLLKHKEEERERVAELMEEWYEPDEEE